MLDKYAPMGYQMAFHCNGDVGFDVVLDDYENALNKHNLIGTNHRWRVEHLDAARADQFQRAERLGVTVSLAPFQFIYWGDLLDGTMFKPEYGSQWQRAGDGMKMKTPTTFHNDGSVSPPDTLRNIQHMVTRTTDSGKVHGANQAVTMDEALRAETIYAAKLIKREHMVGSLEVGKLADFVELSADPYEVDPHVIDEKVKVLGTWLSGQRIDLDAFMANADRMTPAQHDEHAHLAHKAHSHPHRC